MDNVRYQKLKTDLNRIPFAGLKGISLGYALSIPIAYSPEEKKQPLLRHILSILSLLMTIGYGCNMKHHRGPEKKKVMFYFSHIYSQRKDYVLTMRKVKALYGNRCDFTGFYLKHKKITFGSLKYAVYLPIWLWQIRKLSCGLTTRLFFVTYILEAKRWYDYLLKKVEPEKFGALITFFDARLYDNILVQYFKNHRVATATLQHGHFNATRHGANQRQDLGIAFEGFVSNKFLAWGEYTKFEAMKNGLSSKQILCVGCPKYIGYQKCNTRKDARIFGVVLDGGKALTYRSNVEMLQIANELARKKHMKYVIKPHPVSDMSVFEAYIDKRYLHRLLDKNTTVEEYAKTVDFSLAMGSAVYAELLYMDEIAFRYAPKAYRDRYELIQWGAVKNAEELLALIELYRMDPIYVRRMNRIAAKLLCEEGDIKAHYRNAINSLVES